MKQIAGERKRKKVKIGFECYKKEKPKGWKYFAQMNNLSRFNRFFIQLIQFARMYQLNELIHKG